MWIPSAHRTVIPSMTAWNRPWGSRTVLRSKTVATVRCLAATARMMALNSSTRAELFSG